MRTVRRVLGVLWTLAAAIPLAAPAEAHGDSGVVGVSAPGRGPRPESRTSLGAVRIGLGDTVLRDLKTPFVGTPSFRLVLTTRITQSDGLRVRRSDDQTVRRTEQARAPPTLP